MTDSTSSPSKRHQLRYVAGPQGPAFEAQCALEGVKPKDVIKQLIAQHLASRASGERPKLRPVVGEQEGRRIRHELRFNRSELEILQEAALRSGSTVRDYIISVARAHASDAMVGRDERSLLGKINYQLLAIGRNINQIAHRANAFDGVTQQQLDDLRGLEISLRRISAEVHAYLVAGRERWRIVSD